MECPYCQSQVVLKDSRIIYRTRSYGLAWVCERERQLVSANKVEPRGTDE